MFTLQRCSYCCVLCMFCNPSCIADSYTEPTQRPKHCVCAERARAVSRPFCAALRVAKSLLVVRKVAQKLWSVILQKTGTLFATKDPLDQRLSNKHHSACRLVTTPPRRTTVLHTWKSPRWGRPRDLPWTSRCCCEGRASPVGLLRSLKGTRGDGIKRCPHALTRLQDVLHKTCSCATHISVEFIS